MATSKRRDGPNRTIVTAISRAVGMVLTLSVIWLLLGWGILGLVTEGPRVIWWPGILMVLVVAVVWLIIRTNQLRIARAASYHLLIAGLFAFSVLPLIEVATRLLFAVLGAIAWPISLMLVLLLFFLTWIRIRSSAKNLWLAEKENVASRRLDPINTTWNVDAPLWPNRSGPQGQSGAPGIQGALAVAGAILWFALGRLGVQSSPLLWVGMLFALVFLMVPGIVGIQAGIAVQLMSWERSWSKHILLAVNP